MARRIRLAAWRLRVRWDVYADFARRVYVSRRGRWGA